MSHAAVNSKAWDITVLAHAHLNVDVLLPLSPFDIRSVNHMMQQWYDGCPDACEREREREKTQKKRKKH